MTRIGRRLRRRLLLAAAAVLGTLAAAVLLALAPPPARAGDLAPREGWRIRVDAATVKACVDEAGAARIPGLVTGAGDAGAPWPAPGAEGEVWISFELPEPRKPAVLLVLELEAEGDGPVLVALHGSAKADGGKLDEIERGTLEPNRRGKRKGPRIAHLTVPAGRYRKVRLTVGEAGTPAPHVERLRAYALDPKGRNDYWLFVGASLSVGAIDPDAFAADLRRLAPDHDPYVANEAVSGWTAGDVRKALPEILAAHRHARYLAIDIGGNDVTARRPYPGGADRLRADLEGILEAVREAGKVPILARLTYRAYPEKGGKPAVAPEENGSGPYVTEVFDPLIRMRCPDFYDRARKRGVVDLYTYFRDHPDELASDGIHLTKTGSESFRRLWAELAGGVVYGKK